MSTQSTLARALTQEQKQADVQATLPAVPGAMVYPPQAAKKPVSIVPALDAETRLLNLERQHSELVIRLQRKLGTYF